MGELSCSCSTPFSSCPSPFVAGTSEINLLPSLLSALRVPLPHHASLVEWQSHLTRSLSSASSPWSFFHFAHDSLFFFFVNYKVNPLFSLPLKEIWKNRFPFCQQDWRGKKKNQAAAIKNTRLPQNLRMGEVLGAD